jgi:hypothetical protein
MPPRFRFIRRDGSVITGVVHGSGGALSGRDALHRLEVLRRKHLLGRLPRPAQLRVYPEYSAASDGPVVLVDLGNVSSIEEM